MTNAVTDNTISTQNVVLWQYDKAPKFCAVVDLIETWGKKATEALWNYWVERVHGLFTLTGTQQELSEKIDDFSLALWGIFAGVSRPTLTVGETTAPMSKILYRKVLAARLKLLQTNGSLRDISQYCADIFGANKVAVTDGLDMSITYSVKSGVTLTGEEAALFDKGDYWKFYPAGVMDNVPPVTRFVAFKGQYQADLTAKGTVAQTTTKPNFFSGTDDNNIDWKGVFHPKTRSWSFYDEAMKPVTGTYSMAYANGTWTLSSGGSTATQTGHSTSVWCDYGVYFVKGSGTGGTFPSVGIVAVWA